MVALLFEMLSGGIIDAYCPSPDEPCYLSFRVPAQPERSSAPPRLLPQYNDIALRLLWEGGAVLAEYLSAHPNLVKEQYVIQLGVGVGLGCQVAVG
jgi:predicted nicotinamide N-methyase